MTIHKKELQKMIKEEIRKLNERTTDTLLDELKGISEKLTWLVPEIKKIDITQSKKIDQAMRLVDQVYDAINPDFEDQ